MGWRRKAWSIPASAPAKKSQKKPRAPGRRHICLIWPLRGQGLKTDHSTPAPAGRFHGHCAMTPSRRANPMCCGWMLPKKRAMVGPLTFLEYGKSRPADPLRFGDIVLARKDVPAAYHLAVVVDDAFQDIT